MRDRSIAIIGSRGYPSFYGGFETLVRHLAPYLADQGWQVTVYGNDIAGPSDSCQVDRRIRSRRTWGVEWRSLGTLTRGFSSTVSSARSRDSVALVLNIANGFWLPMLRLRGIPTALNVDGIEWEREKWGHLAKGAFHVGARLTARYATALVCDSIAIQQRWERDFSRTGTYIPYGGTTPLNEECPFDLESRKYVLVVARLVPENSITQFFESAAELAKHYRVIIVGCSGYGGRLDYAAAELDRTLPSVQWLGQVRDDRLLLALWRHAGTYFHGHSVGGTNPALVQAMHCGAPTVACDTVFNREVLGNAGVFVEPTRESIIAAVMSVMNDSQLQDRLAQAASNRARQRFTWDIVCSRYNELFDELYRQKNHLGRNAC